MNPWHLLIPPCIFFIFAAMLVAVLFMIRAWQDSPVFLLFAVLLAGRALCYLWLVSISWHSDACNCRIWPGPWTAYNAVFLWFPVLELALAGESLFTTSAMVRAVRGPAPWFRSRDVMIFCWLIGLVMALLIRSLNPPPVRAMTRNAYLWNVCAQACCVGALAANMLLLWLANHWAFTAPEYIWRQGALLLYMTASVIGKAPQQASDWWSSTDIQTGLQIAALASWLAIVSVFRAEPRHHFAG